MARRVASGQLELGSPYPATECTSESEAESVKETFQHVTLRVQKSQEQQRFRRQIGDNVEPWGMGSVDRSESEESDLESAFRSSDGKVEKKKKSSLFVCLHLPADLNFCDFVTIIVNFIFQTLAPKAGQSLSHWST